MVDVLWDQNTLSQDDLQKGVDGVGDDSPANHKSMCQGLGVLRVKRHKASINRQPHCLYMRGGGSVLTQHQSRDTEMDSQRNTHNGSLGWPCALLQISYFTANLQYTIFYNIILGLGKTTNSQDQYPVIHIFFKLINVRTRLKYIYQFLGNHTDIEDNKDYCTIL
jgi:hypothetical protein